MKKLLEHMGPVFKQWADQYFESEIAHQFEDFKKKNPEESAKCDIEIFKDKLMSYLIFSGHSIKTEYLKKDINSMIQKETLSILYNIKLSENLLSFLDQMQNNEDFGIDCYQNGISDAVCFIGTLIHQLDEDKKMTALKHIESLSLTREMFEDLRKQ